MPAGKRREEVEIKTGGEREIDRERERKKEIEREKVGGDLVAEQKGVREGWRVGEGGMRVFPVVTARGPWRPQGIMADGKTLIRAITGSKLVPFSAHHFTLKSMLF